MKKTLWIIGGLLIAFALIAGGAQYFAPAQAPRIETAGSTQAAVIHLTIEGLYQNKEVAVSSGESVLQMLQDTDKADPAVSLHTKEYSGLGTLVTGIHGVENGANGKYWQYKVNGVMSQVGASAYLIQGGDSVDWFFASSSE